MQIADGIGLAAALALIAAFWCQSPRTLRIWALVSGGLLLCYAILLSVLLAIINAVRLRSLYKTRVPTRATWDMDDEVQDRISEIRAQSRYSSAGIEF